MPVQINGQRSNRIVLNSKKVKSICLNGHLVYTTDMQPNQIFSTIPTNAKDCISISNGLETKSFKALGSDVDDFIAQGSANEVLSFKDHKSNEEWTFESGSAPSLIKETDGSYALNFEQGQMSSNGVSFNGNFLVALFQKNENDKEGVLLNSHNLGFKYLFGYNVSNYGSMHYVTVNRMFIGSSNAYGSRGVVYQAINGKYGIVAYDAEFSGNIEWHLSKYIHPGDWDFSGKLKEISCYTIANDDDIIKIVDQIKARHNLI
mgnify:CR=1 FL=1